MENDLDRVFRRVRSATRVALFETGYEDFPTASNGGTLTLVSMGDSVFALTCRHVCRGFEPLNLLIGQNRTSGFFTKAHSFFAIERTIDHAVGSDLDDLVAFWVPKDLGYKWFKEKPLLLSPRLKVPNDLGDKLYAVGNLKNGSTFDGRGGDVSWAELHLFDIGSSPIDVTLRCAQALSSLSTIGSISGISGGPVYNVTKGRLAGIIVRGGTPSQHEVLIHYIDIFDVLQFLVSTRSPNSLHRYRKDIRSTDVRTR